MEEPSLTSLNVLDQNCPSRKLLEILANKWTMLIIRVLSRGTQRYKQLHRQIGGVTEKMLIQTLRQLEEDGLITRKIYDVVPPQVEYSLTTLGETLIEPIDAITNWAEQHIQEVEAARALSRASAG